MTPISNVNLLSKPFLRDLRSDHAGEAGAVMIYKGILAITKDQELRSFAFAHLQTEQKHLAFFDSWLPKRKQSKLLPLWRFSGFLLGFFAAMGTKSLVYFTIKIVEQFVVEHYESQLCQAPEFFRETLLELQSEEKEHQLEAEAHHIGDEIAFLKLWGALVDNGSRLAVKVARLI